MSRAYQPLVSIFVGLFWFSAPAWSTPCFSESFGDYKVEFDGSGVPVLYQKVSGKYEKAPTGKLNTNREVKDGRTTSSYSFTDAQGLNHAYTVIDKIEMVTKRPDTKTEGVHVKYGELGTNAVRYYLDPSSKKCTIYRQFETSLKTVTYDREFCLDMKGLSKEFEKCKGIGEKILKAVESANQRIKEDHKDPKDPSKSLNYVLDYVVNPEDKGSADHLVDLVMKAGSVCQKAPTEVDSTSGSAGGTVPNSASLGL